MKRIIFLIFLSICCMTLVGCKNHIPYIGENGNWWVDDTDTGVAAQGPEGKKGDDGTSVYVSSIEKTKTENNEDTYTIIFSDNTRSEFKVVNGTNGNSVKVDNVTLKESLNGIDTYELCFSDGYKSTFKVTNGKNITSINIEKKASEGLLDTYCITFSDNSTQEFVITNGATPYIGENGNWWINGEDTGVSAQGPKGDDGNSVFIISIEKTNTENCKDTYTITFSDNSTKQFIVTNGTSPYIGENGNWWINGIDTGVLADSSKEDKREITLEQKIMQTGLQYEACTINGISGYFVSDYDTSLLRLNANEFDYLSYKNVLSYEEYLAIGEKIVSGKLDLIIPNYIGSVPVIGISETFRQSRTERISFSENLIYLPDNAFENYYNLVEVDFNNCKLDKIPANCFKECDKLTSINLPDTVIGLGDYAFYKCPLSDFNFENIKYIGDYALTGLEKNIYLPKNVEYVGDYAFGLGYLYLEKSEIPESWGKHINGTIDFFSTPVPNCKNNGEYIYSINNERVTLYQYLGQDKKMTIPTSIEGKPVKSIGYGFNSSISVYSYIHSCYEEDLLKKNNHLLEIIIPGSIEKIEYGALLCGDAFIYVSKGVKEVDISTGMFYGDDERFGYLVFEDATDIDFIDDENILSYDEYLVELGELEFRMCNGVVLENIYYDESTKAYYVKENSSYTLLANFDFFESKIVIPDRINGLPVTLINSFAFVYSNNLSKIIIGSNIRKIKTYAFCNYGLNKDVMVYIPSNVEIINSNAFEQANYFMYFIESSKKPDDWDSNWNDGNSNVFYSYSLSDFNDTNVYD